jgi:hypothetical protein
MDMALAIVVVLVVLAAIGAATLLVGYERRQWQERQGIAGAQPSAPPLDGGWHGPSASGGFPAVPSQRTGEHDRAARSDREPG